MSRSAKNRKQPRHQRAPRGRWGPDPARRGPSSEKRGRGRTFGIGGVSWFFEQRPALRFVVLVCVMMGLYYAGISTGPVRKGLFPAYLRVNADLSAGIIRVLGRPAMAAGVSVVSPEFSLSIQKGCDAIDPSALFAAGVLAFQVSLTAKLPALLIGTLSLLAINLVRIVSLFYVGIHFPKAFHAMHVDVWQPAFILLAIALWAAWALLATRPAASKSADSGCSR